jgi:hypothetical protein
MKNCKSPEHGHMKSILSKSTCVDCKMEYFNDWLDQEVKGAQIRLKNAGHAVRSAVNSTDGKIPENRTLNALGELQQLGPQYDAAVAALAALFLVREEFIKAFGEKDDDTH